MVMTVPTPNENISRVHALLAQLIAPTGTDTMCDALDAYGDVFVLFSTNLCDETLDRSITSKIILVQHFLTNLLDQGRSNSRNGRVEAQARDQSL
jgi:hypothetical protein